MRHAASFQQAVVDVLVEKTVAAAERHTDKIVLQGEGSNSPFSFS